jgi:class 3 adenylate cyclase/tetratricopeptide (TPR) repeat protein
MLVCTNCRSQNPDGAKFCNQCGTALGKAAPADDRKSYTPKHLVDRVLKSRAAIEGERKRVTVLFADIKGSTRLAEQAGAERWHEILDRFFSILSAAVHRYEGTVNQYTGDGIMALFGAPIAHEDHAQRASLAALAMQAEVRSFADELRLKSGLNLSMRVGLNTGEVIVGRIGDDLRMDYTAQGLTVNLAARMEHICEPGRIYATRNTATLVEGYFKLRDLGDMSVQGSSAPIRVYEVEGEGQLRTRLSRSLARGGSRFIGREPELDLLRGAVARATAGDGQVVAIVGNAGIGKSRLCHEFTLECERAGLPVHRSTGVPYANALPLYPVQTLVRSRLGLPENCSHSDVRRLVAGTFLLRDPANAQLLPHILDFLGAGQGGAGSAPDDRERVLDLLASYIPSAETPQVLLVEDLHFADPESEEFLSRMLKYVRSTSTLLLVNYRPDYVSEYLIPHLDEQIAVSALSPQQLDELAQSLLGGHPSLEGIAQQIRARASGNPFFVEEAVQALQESGHLTGGRGAYTLARPIAEWPIPDTVHALIAARIDRLPEEMKSLLHAAAVIGQDFRPRLLANLAAVEEEPCEERLGLLEDAGFVNQKQQKTQGEREYAFCHPLTQEVAYTSQLEGTRAAAHARLAQMLEVAHPLSSEPSEISVQTAHHWRCAGNWARAGQWNLHAIRWAGVRDPRVARRQALLAIEHFDKAPRSPEVLAGAVGARSALIRTAQFTEIATEEVDRAYREGRQLAEESGNVVATIELIMSYGAEQGHRGRAWGAAEMAKESLELARRHGAGEFVGRFRLAYLLPFSSTGRQREGIELISAACGDAWLTAPITLDNFSSRGLLALMNCMLGDLKRAKADMDAALEVSLTGDRAASWMHSNLVDYAWFSGDYSDALSQARTAVLKAEQFGSPFFRALSARALALALILNDEAPAALPFLLETLPIVGPGGLAHQFEGNHLSTLSWAYFASGDAQKALEVARKAIASAQSSGARTWEAYAWLSLLRLPPEYLGEDQASEGFARMSELITAIGAEGLRPHYLLARRAWARNDAERADLRAQALAGFERIGAEGYVRRLRSEAS